MHPEDVFIRYRLREQHSPVGTFVGILVGAVGCFVGTFVGLDHVMYVCIHNQVTYIMGGGPSIHVYMFVCVKVCVRNHLMV